MLKNDRPVVFLLVLITGFFEREGLHCYTQTSTVS
jgi:hypothetical protein